jgi:hypothetical protein
MRRDLDAVGGRVAWLSAFALSHRPPAFTASSEDGHTDEGRRPQTHPERDALLREAARLLTAQVSERFPATAPEPRVP